MRSKNGAEEAMLEQYWEFYRKSGGKAALRKKKVREARDFIFAYFYRRLDSIMGGFSRFGPEADDAWICAQEALLRAVEGYKPLAKDKTNIREQCERFLHYYRRIFVRQWICETRLRPSRKIDAWDPNTYIEEADASEVIGRTAYHMLATRSSALISLLLLLCTPRQRQILKAIYRQGMSVDEVAKDLGLPRSKVLYYKNEGLTRIRDALSKSSEVLKALISKTREEVVDV